MILISFQCGERKTDRHTRGRKTSQLLLTPQLVTETAQDRQGRSQESGLIRFPPMLLVTQHLGHHLLSLLIISLSVLCTMKETFFNCNACTHRYGYIHIHVFMCLNKYMRGGFEMIIKMKLKDILLKKIWNSQNHF